MFTSSISPGLCIPFLPSGRHILFYPFTRWESLSTLLLPSSLSLSPPVSQSFLNALFYHVCCSFWNLIPFALPPRPVSAIDSILYIIFCSFLSPFRIGLTNPGRALGRSSDDFLYYQIGTPSSSSSQSHHLRLSLAFPYSTPRLLYLPYDSTLIHLLCHLMSGPFVSNLLSHFRLARLAVKLRLYEFYWRALACPLTRSCFLLLLLGRLLLLALLSSESASLHCVVHSFLSILCSLSPRCSSHPP